MAMLSFVGWLLVVAASSALLTGIIVFHARRKQWLAVPNARSSHAVPTPSSGGIGMVLVILGATVMLAGVGVLDGRLATALVGGGIIVAIAGWADDRWKLSARVRIVAYTVAAAWALAWIGGLDHLTLGTTTIVLGWSGNVLALLAIVGLANVYNFMDGIDGFMGAEAVFVGGVLMLLAVGAPGIAVLSSVIAAAALGFLVWNWHPARIFMGDVGSVFLGFTFATIAIALEQSRVLPGLLVAALLALVLVDGIGTTLRRAITGMRWWEAHRTFSYQRAVQRGYRHSTVVLGAMAWNVPIIALVLLAWSRSALLLPAFIGAIMIAAIPWAWYQWHRGASDGGTPRRA